MLDYVQVKRSLEDMRRMGLPYRCWCAHERENVIQLRSKYESAQLCSNCRGTI